MKEEVIIYAKDQTLNGVTVEVELASISVATPNKIYVGGLWVQNVAGLGQYARLHNYATKLNYRWSGNLADIDENTSLDDPRWVLE